MSIRAWTNEIRFGLRSLLAFASICSAFMFSLPSANEAQEKSAEKEAKPKLLLPEDPKTPVISLDFKGGFTPPRINDSPTISIFADGTVVIPKNYDGQKAYEGKLTPAELRGLLDEIINEQKFFEYDPKEVANKVQQAENANGLGLAFRVADAATTVIKVQLADRKHEVSEYNLSPHPKVLERRQLHAIQQRLTKLMSVIQLGGADEVERWLKVANTELKTQHPKVEPLTKEDFMSGGERADGSRYVYFQRREPRKGGPDAEAGTTVVSINAPKEGPPKINVVHKPSKSVSKT